MRYFLIFIAVVMLAQDKPQGAPGAAVGEAAKAPITDQMRAKFWRFANSKANAEKTYADALAALNAFTNEMSAVCIARKEILLLDAGGEPACAPAPKTDTPKP